MPKLGIRVNLSNGGLTQVAGWDFNSVAEFHDIVIGLTSAGISTLGTDDDNGTDIDAYVSVPLGNFGIPNPKRIRKGYIEYETDGAIKVICKASEQYSFAQTLTILIQVDKETATVFFGNRSVYGVNWGFELENIDGADFSIDYFGILFIPLSRHRSL